MLGMRELPAEVWKGLQVEVEFKDFLAAASPVVLKPVSTRSQREGEGKSRMEAKRPREAGGEGMGGREWLEKRGEEGGRDEEHRTG